MGFKKQLLLNLGLAFLSTAIMAAAVQLIAADLTHRALKIRDQKSELALRSQAAELLNDWKGGFEKAKPLFTILNQVLPPQTDAVGFGQKLTGLAKNFKIELGISFGGEITGNAETPAASNFSLTGKSAYANFVRFLKEAGKIPLFIKLNSIDLTRRENSDIFNFAINAQVFHQ